MHDDRELVEERITRELTERVLPHVHPERLGLAVEAGPSLDALAPFAVGRRWGAPWGTTWFRLCGEVPARWSGRRIEALIDLGFRADAPGFQCEGLVRDGAGRPVQGIHPRRQAVPVTTGPGPVVVVVEAASNPRFPQFVPSAMGSPGTAGDELLYRLERAELVVVDVDAEALVHDLGVLDGVMRTLALDDPRRPRLLAVLERALDVLATGRDDAVVAARAVLAPALATPAGPSAHRVVATGHAHIDTAWLWRISETVRKCTRTFASALTMMDEDPTYRFSCSQAQQLAWMAEREPELFGRIEEKVAAGQWIPVGGMWVEPDMNLPSGESIVRQIVHGQRWFEAHLGRRCTEVWIPDVFGYPAGLPQVFVAGGMRRFVTQKLSWNRTNRFPHSTFWWEGVDGSRVLTHFPPVDTYNAEVTPAELAHSVRRFADHAWSRWSLLPFGYGDGGGGPTHEMLERRRRVTDLDGMPQVELGSPTEFFARVEAEVAAGAPVPVWRGELYFETHRGTLTSQLRTKAGNRRSERLLREAELWTATAGETNGRRLDGLWQAVLTQQFHDILPGSSIAWVHADAEEVHARVADELEEVIGGALATVAPDGPVLANPATLDRDEVVVAAVRPGGRGAVQQLPDGRSAFRAKVPGLGLAPAVAELAAERVVVTDRSISNGRLAVAWDLDGNLRSIIDVARARELVPAGELGAVLELAPDQPVRYDAWDVESWVRREPQRLLAADDVAVAASGPLVGMVRVQRSFGPSSAVVTYVLRAGSPRLDVHVEVDWHHVEHLLSIAFPLDVHAADATCGIQFGAVRRPRHASTSWDAAKFEVCAHRWVDVAEPSFGVAVLDDGRYGHALLEGAVRISLARSARYPDPSPDQGRHEVTLALLPHGPGLAEVVSEAERLTLPVRAFDGGSGTGGVPSPLIRVTGAGVEVDAVKPADDGRGDIVVRLHEACGDRVRATVAADRRIVAASSCDLLETPHESHEVGDGIVTLTLRPFQLVTLRLTRDER